MLLAGAKAIYEAAEKTAPQNLALRVSALATPEQIAEFVTQPWPAPTGKHADQNVEDVLIDGLLDAVPGGAHLESAKEHRVLESFEGNVYVGIQVALSLNDKKRPTFNDVLVDGPADRAGIKPGDVIEEINGASTEGQKLRETVDRLRGPEGSDVAVTFRSPKSNEVRTVKLTRSRLPRKTISGVSPSPESGPAWILDGPMPIGYLRFSEIGGSTPQELRQLARRLEKDEASAVLLDLRGVRQANFHATVLVADALLNAGVIGRVKTGRAEQVFRSDSDELFRGKPMAVLVDNGTAGAAEWLVAALQDLHRAVVLGSPTAGLANFDESVPILDGAYVVNMTTGRMARADGRTLTRRVPTAPDEDAGVRRRIPAAEEAATAAQSGRVVPDELLRDMGPTQPPASVRGRAHANDRQPTFRDKAVEAARQRLVKELRARDSRVTLSPR